MSFGSLVVAALKATAKVLAIVGFGIYVKRRGFYNDVVRRGHAKLSVQLFLPMLLLHRVSSSVTLPILAKWWTIPVFVIMYTSLGCLLGFIYGTVFRLGKGERRFAMACCGFPNVTSLPLALVESIVLTAPELAMDADDTPDAESSRGFSYVLVFTVFATVARWTIAYNLLGPPQADLVSKKELGTALLEPGERAEAEGAHIVDVDKGSSTADGDNAALKDRRDPSSSSADAGGEDTAVVDTDDHDMVVPRMTFKEQLKKCLTPPVYASAIAIIIGITPPLKWLFYSSNGPLTWLALAAHTTGGATVPTTLMVLGGAMADGPKTSRHISAFMIGTLTVLKQVVMPCIAIGLVKAFEGAGLFPNDPIYRLVLLLESATPAAINLSIIASLHNYREKEMSTFLFYTYVFSVLTLTVNVIVFLKVV